MSMTESIARAREIFIEHYGMLRSVNARKLGINPNTLARMVKKEMLIKEKRGLYRLIDFDTSNHADIISVHQQISSAIFCLISALAFYELTTQIPHKIYIALPRTEKNRPKINYPPLDVVWLSEKPYHAGVEFKNIDGIMIPFYSREKTIADCFKFRNKIGKDVALEALKKYVSSKERNLSALINFSQINRVEKIMQPHLESLLES